jgi:hypothetical protein
MDALVTKAENVLLSNRGLQDRVSSQSREVTQLSKSHEARRYNALWATAQKAKLDAQTRDAEEPVVVQIPPDEARGYAIKFALGFGVLALFLINRPLQDV